MDDRPLPKLGDTDNIAIHVGCFNLDGLIKLRVLNSLALECHLKMKFNTSCLRSKTFLKSFNKQNATGRKFLKLCYLNKLAINSSATKKFSDMFVLRFQKKMKRLR